MNKRRREVIDGIIQRVAALAEEVAAVEEEEQDALDNLPENMQEGAKGEKMQEAIDALESAADSLNEAADSLTEAMG